MVSYKSYVAGWLLGSIHDVLKAFSPTPDNMAYALITSLDSNVTPARLLNSAPCLASLGSTARALGESILVTTEGLILAEHQSPIFFGFDEVWFFPNDNIQAKPTSSWIVGPSRIDKKKLSRLGGWMERNGCCCGLGDGEGTNFVVEAEGISKYILSYSLEQSAPDEGAKIAASRG